MIIDWTTRIWKWFDHNPGISIAALAAVLVTFLGPTACQGKAANPETGEKMTSTQLSIAGLKAMASIENQREFFTARINSDTASMAALDSEGDATAAAFNEAMDTADAETERNTSIVRAIPETATSLGIPGVPVVSTILALFAAGVGGDNIRKGAKIKRDKAEKAALLEVRSV